MVCKNCAHFIQGKGHRGACKKKPYVTDRRGTTQRIKGVPRVFVAYWAKKACRMFEKGGAE